jgi:hypothetical protein
MKCWENSITLSISKDGGRTFNESKSPDNIVAALPYRYRGDVGHPIGYFQPTNVVKLGGLFYIMFHAEAYRDQAWGECVSATRTPFTASSWRAWDGHKFRVRLGGAYLLTNAQTPNVCTPVGKGSLFDFGSLTFDPVSDSFIAITSIQHGGGNSWTPPGVYYAISKNLIDWSLPTLLESEEKILSHDNKKSDVFEFFSLIDHQSTSPTFFSGTSKPDWYLYYVVLDQSCAPYCRQLVRTKVSIKWAPPIRP